MTCSHYVPFDLLDDLHDGAAAEPRTFNDRLLCIVRLLPRDFSLRDIYRHARELQQLFPENSEIEAAIRAGIQELRDAGLVQFRDYRGRHRRGPAAEPVRRSAA
jgi:hypothetical protein